MDKNELLEGFHRVGASYRALPTDELLGELKHLQNWARGFMAQAVKADDKHLVGDGLVIVLPFVMELIDALLPKLEVLYGIHAIDAKDDGAVRKQVVEVLQTILNART